MKALRTIFGKIFGRRPPTADPRPIHTAIHTAIHTPVRTKDALRDEALRELRGGQGGFNPGTIVRIERLPPRPHDNPGPYAGNGYHTRQSRDPRPPAVRAAKKAA